MSELDGETDVGVKIELPDPFAGVNNELAAMIKEYFGRPATTVKELVELMDEGSKISANLPKITIRIGKKSEIKHKYPLLNAAILRHLRDLQNKRLVLDTFG